jgi:ketosteroid isomerase-like protein
MRASRLAFFIMLCAGIAVPASAAGSSPEFVQDIEPDAQEAVAVVEVFSAAIKAVRIDEASALLDPKVLVLESGGSERSRDQYLAEHAQADADYMKDARQALRYRQARRLDDIAWVGTESVVSHDKAGKTASSLSTETMVLKKSAQGWRIVHIHWSSSPAPANK